MEKLKALMHDKDKMRELFLYVLFGALTTAVNWVVYFLTTKLLGLDGYPTDSRSYYLIANAAQLVAWILSVLFAFVTNKRYVFLSKATRENGAWKEFWLFVSARIASLLIFDLALFNLLLALGMNDKWDKLFMNVLVIIFNYIASRFVVFRKKQ